MDYQKVYDQLVQKNHTFSKGEYFETHHKTPLSLGGNDEKSNLVNLTAREHYIAHLLLVKITEQNGDIQAHSKMLYAFNCMKWGRCKGKRSFKFNSRLYHRMKEEYSKLRRTFMRNETNPMKGKIWIHSDELKKSKIWDKKLPISQGWKIGRKITSWNSENIKLEKRLKRLNEQLMRVKEKCKVKERRLLQREEKKLANEKRRNELLEKHRQVEMKRITKSILKQRIKEQQAKIKEEHILLLNEMFIEFKKNEYDGVVRKFGYNHTRNALIMMFKKYIPEYVPQECNRWKNRNK